MLGILKVVPKVFLTLVLCVVVFALIAFLYYKLINKNPNLNRVYLDVTYKRVHSQDLKLDIHMPKRQIFRKIPVLLYYHGGGWEGGSKTLKKSDLEVVGLFMEAGFAVVSVEYRLTDENTKFPLHFEDAADAIRWIIKSADEYDLNGNKINLIGTSAGGQIALLLGIAGDKFKGDPALADVEFRIKSVIDLCGPTDFTDLSDFDPAINDELTSKLADFFGGTYHQMPEQYELASPIYQINKNSPPIFMSHGVLDNVVPVGQAEKFYKKSMAVEANVTYVPVENANHKFKAPENEITKPLVKDVLFDMVVFLLKKNIFSSR